MAEVSRRSHVILIHEIVKYHVSKLLPEFFFSPGSSALLSQNGTHLSIIDSLEDHGSELGSRIVSRLTVTRGRIWDANKCMVFLCRELWIYLFGRQAKRLQSNGQGVYIVFCDDLYWLENLQFNYLCGVDSASQAALSEAYRGLYLSLIAGVLKGCVNSLGFSSAVTGEFDKSCRLTHIFRQIHYPARRLAALQASRASGPRCF